MVKVASYTKLGNKQDSQVTLDTAVFGVEPNAGLLQLAYRAYLANGRNAAPQVLNRGDVSGGGKKPWRQKGTGRARVGSSRVPNWRGGGVVFGPTGLENHTLKLSAGVKRQAVRQALSAQAKDDKLMVIEDFAADGKVKPTIELLSKLKASGRILLVVGQKDQLVDRATRNIAGLKTVQAKYLNVYDLLNADTIIVTKKSVEIIKDWLGA